MLAGVAPCLRLGTLVSPVTFRRPGVLAKAMATLDVITGGLAFCGLGAGWWDREHAAFRLPFPPAKERFDQLEAAIETLRALWRPGTKAYAGYRVSFARDDLLPAARLGHPDHRRRLR
jgi:alkanesulfonate monooxygenase SsuD/methylene tetrahydromethanopterin reductase-like flavin-dependent oxidoreductase (luciferase family)